LRPKKVKDLIPQLAKELQLSEKEVASVIDAYWGKVRKTLSSLEHNNVFIKGLGTFQIKPWAVESRLKSNDHQIDRYTSNPTAGSLSILNDLFKDNIKLKAVKDKHTEQLKIRDHKRYVRRNQNLEGEGQDS
jgi:hypothetical protein